MRVRLQRKFAELINDVNLSTYRVGQVIDLSTRDARVLVAEGWAVEVARENSLAQANIIRRSPRRRQR
jgi:hypothetical protein